MSAVAFYQARYLASKTAGKSSGFKEIDSTIKWAEHKLAIFDMKKIMEEEQLTFDDRVTLRRATEVAERKCLWHYKRDNFDLRRASFLLETAKRAT